MNRRLVAAVLVSGCVLALRAELNKWAENIDAGNRLEAVFFRNVTLPSGAVSVRRPPKETRPALDKLIEAAPRDAELISLRALEAEQQLDFAAAEADWKKYVDVAADRGAARLALADFYRRRLKPQDEFVALAIAALEAPPASEKLLSETQQRSWKTYERLFKLIDEQRLDASTGINQYWAWIARYPRQSVLYRNFFEYVLSHNQAHFGDEIVAGYERAFPNEPGFAVEARATLAARRGAPADAITAYERSFRPLWDSTLVTNFFALLKQTGGLRAYLERTRAAAASNPTDLAPAAKLFYYWQQQGNVLPGERALIEFRQRKEARRSTWTADELLTLGRLFEISHNYDEAARNYYAMYAAAGVDNAAAETALASLTRLLLSVPEQPIRFGAANLTLYRDVASMDPHPGFLNGILSLVLNNADPAQRYADEERDAGSYFRRTKAAELVGLFESRFPTSPARAELRERLIDAYAVHGSSAGVIVAGTSFLTDFPNAANRTAVALRMADAYSRQNQSVQEFALYDLLLSELSKRADGVPLGSTPPAPAQQNARQQNTPQLRSPEYARVLDRYVARLVGLKRVPDALALYRREIDRNADDPGLYDVLAAFLEQNRLGAETEQVYQQAIARFQDRSWSQKLARWYLRQRRAADMTRLTRDVVRIFSGTELESYFRAVVGQAAPVGPALYLQLNISAHQRFPHHLNFVRNLLTAYTTPATQNDAAFDALLRQHWYDAEDLRLRFFNRLSRAGRLDNELAVLRTTNPAVQGSRWSEAQDLNPAVVRMLAEGEAWRSHFEVAAPMFSAISAVFPADGPLGRRTAMLHRSLGAPDASIAIEERLAQSEPRDSGALTRIGEVEADRERFDRANGYWNRIPAIVPGESAGYIEAATIFWDYYRYDDALRLIEDARKNLQQPSLFAYEAGAIQENRRDYNRAALEYARGSLAQPGSPSQERLLLLARRPALKDDIESLTANLATSRNPDTGAFQLRVALLRNQNRRDDLEKFLLEVAARANATEVLTAVHETARVDGLPRVQQASLDRQIILAGDPVERMRLRLALARYYEGQGAGAAAAQTVDSLYRENPAILGVVRAAVDYHWRNKNPKRAIDVLEEAAGRAQAEYRPQFTLEAARKSTESADYARSRGFAAKLLAIAPDNAEYVAAMADTYARAGDDRGLRAYYETRLRGAGGRAEQAAAIRRALIPVLTRVRDFSSAVDQYIEILNKFPEDEALTREAAGYAASNGVGPKLRDYYAKATTDSPKDFRWPMVLARIETQREDYPAAIAAYNKASDVRPDRADLITARLNLEERLLRFDAVAISATKLYDLSYRDPRWMEKLAEVRARQGQTAAAVAAITKAWLEGRPDAASNFFSAAAKLEQWGMLTEARKFAEDGLKRTAASPAEAIGYRRAFTRILVRLRDYDAALAQFTNANATTGAAIAQAFGTAVGSFASAEDKTRIVTLIDRNPRRIEIAQSAGLAEPEARWRALRMQGAPTAASASRDRERLVELQHARLRYAELAQQMEAFDRVLPPAAKRGGELEEAAAAFRAAGNTGAELRVLDRLHKRSPLSGPLFERYCRLLMVQPQRLVAQITAEAASESANGMVGYVLQHGNFAQSQQAIAARGGLAGPLWTNAYTALAGLYFANTTPAVSNAFTAALGDMTVGSRIGKPVDREQQLAGDVWFYYGSRLGEYLNTAKQPGAEDFLPAMVEATPGRSEAYFLLAEDFADAGNTAAAAVDYRNALELNPARADVHDRLAVLASKAGRSDEAIAEWKLAITAFAQMMDRSRVPGRFWTDLADTLRHIGEAKALSPLRDDVDKLLRTYIRRNGNYQVDGLLEAAVSASGDAASGVAWVTELSRSAVSPAQFLSAMLERPWIPAAQKDMFHARIVETSDLRVSQTFGDQQEQAKQDAWNRRIEWARSLVERRQNDRARTVLAALPDEARKTRANELVALDVQLASRTGTLAALLARYPEPAPVEDLRRAASDLLKSGDATGSRRVLEFVYLRDLKLGRLDAANFLGLAEIRLEERNAPAAMTLLRRMALVSGEPFRALEPAATLLQKSGHEAEAAEFLDTLVKAEPWNAEARTQLAIVRGGAAPAAPAKPTGDAAMRERALLAIVANEPANRAAKVEAFRAALEARHDELAIAIGRELLPPHMREGLEYDPYLAESFLGDLPQADRVAIARGLGAAYQRVLERSRAAVFYQIAQRLEPTDGIGRTLAAVKTQIQLAAKNESRRPLVTEALEQDRVVRPRVTQ